MLTITPEAVNYIKAKGKPIFLDMPPLISGDIPVKESPNVRFGQPRNPDSYDLECIQGVSVYVPRDLPKQPLTITLVRFLGWQRLVVEGWHLA